MNTRNTTSDKSPEPALKTSKIDGKLSAFIVVVSLVIIAALVLVSQREGEQKVTPPQSASVGDIAAQDVATAANAAGEISVYPVSEDIVNPQKAYSYEDMVTDLQALQERYPSLIEIKELGTTLYGRTLYAAGLGSRVDKTGAPLKKTTVFFNAAHHAREWITTSVVMYMLEQYARSYAAGEQPGGYDTQDLLSRCTLWFMPMVNPDGVALQQDGLAVFPADAHDNLLALNEGSDDFFLWKSNARGVDLNRQYDADWDIIEGTAPEPGFATYKGVAPATEPEVKAVLAFVDEIDPTFSVSYHTAGRVIYWDYETSKAQRKRDQKYVKDLAKITGYQPVDTPKKSGTGFTDWFTHELCKPSVTLEICKRSPETADKSPLKEFNRVWKENKLVGWYVAQQGLALQ